jgi:formylglycine-generating enzyme required for sulfatase activity
MKKIFSILLICFGFPLIAQTYPGNLAPINGGTFIMGNNSFSPNSSDQGPEHEVTISDFSIGETEVTNQYFITYLNEMNSQGKLSVTEGVPGDWSSDSVDIANGTSWNIVANTDNGNVWDQKVLIELSSIAGGGQNPLNRCWIEWDSISNIYSIVEGYENWPAAWVSWYGAMMYCDYYKVSLPTEAEWEYAGKGGEDFEYATNNGSLTINQANYGSGFGGPSGLTYLTPVATLFLPNPYGLYNMAGNVSEWCLDWYSPTFYQVCADSNLILNPINNWLIDSVELRVLRGGNHTYPGIFATNTNRFDTPPFVTTDHMGFRVVERSSSVGLVETYINDANNIERILMRVVNILGQNVNPESQSYGTILLYLYNDGSVEKKITE